MKGQLTKLGVEVLLNAYMEADDVVAHEAERVILTTGSVPVETGFQKALPSVDIMPGIERGGVWPIEAVMARQAKLGKKGLILDEGGGWRGCGTAWKLAEDEYEVVILSPDAMNGKELQRCRCAFAQDLARLGVKWRLEVTILEWRGDGVTVLDNNTGERSFIEGVALVTTTTNTAADWLARDLDAREHHVDRRRLRCTKLPIAFFDGRNVARDI